MTESCAHAGGVLGGFPRLAGQRIGVHHILGTLKSYGDEDEAADKLGINIEAVQASVAYAEAHPGVMAEVDREREASLERVRERAGVVPRGFVVPCDLGAGLRDARQGLRLLYKAGRCP